MPECQNAKITILQNNNSTQLSLSAIVIFSGGSSSGEGVLVASAASPFGIGNDIGGSIRIPATMCGIFGLKPTNFPNHTLPVDGLVPDFSAYCISTCIAATLQWPVGSICRRFAIGSFGSFNFVIFFYFE
jgi:hypothetical protein